MPDSIAFALSLLFVLSAIAGVSTSFVAWKRRTTLARKRAGRNRLFWTCVGIFAVVWYNIQVGQEHWGIYFPNGFMTYVIGVFAGVTIFFTRANLKDLFSRPCI